MSAFVQGTAYDHVFLHLRFAGVCSVPLSIATPFGEFKDSGIGREKGIGGLRLYQQTKSLYFGLK